MIVDDMLKVIYAPKQAFKKIVENPKYLGAIVILLLFIGIQIGYEYSQVSKVYLEQSSPSISFLPAFTNVTMWTGSSNVALSGSSDSFNYTVYEAGYGYFPELFGNTSLQMDSNSSSFQTGLNIEAALSDVNNTLVAQQAPPLTSLSVDCSETGFQNLTMVIKLVNPQTTPGCVTLNLYSLTDTDYYQYDLTSSLTNTSLIGKWNNITIPVGKTAVDWTAHGVPTWSNITSMTLSFTYPNNSNVTLNIGALFFHGQYQTLVQLNSTGFILTFLQQFSLQFLFVWLIFSALVYLFFKGLKNPVLWKPLFIAFGFAMFVMVIRALINLIATATLPTVYYPFDSSPSLSLTAYGAIFYPAELAGTLFAQSQALISASVAASATFASITLIAFFLSYVWLAILGVVIIGTIKPEVSIVKRVVFSAVSVAITWLLLVLLIGVA
jgi:hypothetical protein